MITIPCPWCEHEVSMRVTDGPETYLRCDDCSTVVDLAPLAVVEPDIALSLAA